MNFIIKQKIRLSEADLHTIIRESVNKVLNEVGDTPRGQYMLGKLGARNFKRGKNNNLSDYEAFQAAVEPVTVADKERKKAAEKWDKEHTYGSFTEPSGPGSEPYEMLNQFRTGWNKHMSKNENHIHNIVKEAISRVLKEKY